MLPAWRPVLRARKLAAALLQPGALRLLEQRACGMPDSSWTLPADWQGAGTGAMSRLHPALLSCCQSSAQLLQIGEWGSAPFRCRLMEAGGWTSPAQLAQRGCRVRSIAARPAGAALGPLPAWPGNLAGRLRRCAAAVCVPSGCLLAAGCWCGSELATGGLGCGCDLNSGLAVMGCTDSAPDKQGTEFLPLTDRDCCGASGCDCSC